MARAWLLIFLIVFGPGGLPLCPCSAQQFVSSLFASKLNGAVQQVPKAPCCPGLPTPVRGVPSRGQSSGGSECPCQSRGETVVVSTGARQFSESSVKRRTPLISFPRLRSFDIAGLRTKLSLIAELDDFLSPRDRLHVICLMRC